MLRGHLELITAVVKGGRGGKGEDEGLALHLMAQLLERVEAASRALTIGHRPSTRGDELMAPQLARAQDSATIKGGGGGVTGHLRGLLQFIGVALPSPAPVQAAPTGRVAAQLAGVGVEEEAELDRGVPRQIRQASTAAPPGPGPSARRSGRRHGGRGWWGSAGGDGVLSSVVVAGCLARALLAA